MAVRTCSGHTWTLDSLVMVGIDTDFFLFGRERVLAVFERFELVVRLEIRPSPDAAVDHVRQTLAMRHLESAVQRARDCDTLGGLARLRQSPFQLFHRSLLLLQLLYQRVDRLFRPFLFFVALFPTCGSGQTSGKSLASVVNVIQIAINKHFHKRTDR